MHQPIDLKGNEMPLSIEFEGLTEQEAKRALSAYKAKKTKDIKALDPTLVTKNANNLKKGMIVLVKKDETNGEFGTNFMEVKEELSWRGYLKLYDSEGVVKEISYANAKKFYVKKRVVGEFYYRDFKEMEEINTQNSEKETIEKLVNRIRNEISEDLGKHSELKWGYRGSVNFRIILKRETEFQDEKIINFNYDPRYGNIDIRGGQTALTLRLLPSMPEDQKEKVINLIMQTIKLTKEITA